MITCLLQCDVVHEIGNVKKDIYDVARDICCDEDARYSTV
jgi:hypothetical protein